MKDFWMLSTRLSLIKVYIVKIDILSSIMVINNAVEIGRSMATPELLSALFDFANSECGYYSQVCNEKANQFHRNIIKQGILDLNFIHKFPIIEADDFTWITIFHQGVYVERVHRTEFKHPT